MACRKNQTFYLTELLRNLSTLHVQPCDYPRMTRGQVGSLRLTCTTLAFATSRRFIPAHSKVGPKPPDQTKKEADSPRIGLSLYRIIAMPRRIVLSLEKPFPIGHQGTLRRRSAKAKLREVRGLSVEFVAQRLVSGETPAMWRAARPIVASVPLDLGTVEKRPSGVSSKLANG